jgi:hypothetical protein
LLDRHHEVRDWGGEDGRRLWEMVVEWSDSGGMREEEGADRWGIPVEKAHSAEDTRGVWAD